MTANIYVYLKTKVNMPVLSRISRPSKLLPALL